MQIKHYLDVVRLNRTLFDFPMLKLLGSTSDLGFVPLVCTFDVGESMEAGATDIGPVLSRRITLIEGPSATAKTGLVSKIILYCSHMQRKWLLVAETQYAVQVCSERIHKSETSHSYAQYYRSSPARWAEDRQIVYLTPYRGQLSLMRHHESPAMRTNTVGKAQDTESTTSWSVTSSLLVG